MRSGATFGLLITAALVVTSSATTGAAAPPTWTSRMASAGRYADSRAGTIGFAVVDESDRLHGYHARDAAYSASLLKPMLLVAYLRRAGVRGRALAPWEREMLTPMIRRSANADVPRLIGLVREWRLKRHANAAGMGDFVLNMPYWGSSETTPRGQASFFRGIERLIPSRHRAYAMRLLATIVPSQRWGAGRVPHGRWRLYFKGGWSTGTGFVDHQVALYRSGAERFSLALFTRYNPDHEYGKETLRGLVSRLLAGVARPGRWLPRAGRVALTGRYATTAPPGCARIAIRPTEGKAHTFPSGASSCAGFELVSGGSRALWSWPVGSTNRLATVGFDSAAPSDLGDFDTSDPLGALAGNGPILAYAHGNDVSVVGGPDCPVTAAALGIGGGRIATGSGSVVRILDPGTCAVERSLNTVGSVVAIALDTSLLASLSRDSAGRVWLERFDISSGARLGARRIGSSTLPNLSVRSPWILHRTSRALRLLAAGSGKSWTVWRSSRVQLGARLVGGRIRWVENSPHGARLWSLRLPAT